MQLSIIIVNYNVKYFLEQCLCSVLKACAGMSAEIIVVDNNSTDDSKTYFENRFASVRFIWLNENIGFAKANNKGLQYATGEYILFLNPDTIVPEDCFTSCISFLQKQNNNGALGIRMIDGSGDYLKESKRGFPSAFASFCKLSGLTNLFPSSKLFASYYMAHLPANKNNEVDVLAGAYMMMPKKIIEAVGSFDEQFFMYGEDVDLSYRIKKAGYCNYYFADTTIIHFKGESTKRTDAKYIDTFYNAMKLFVNKHYSKWSAFFYSWFIAAIAQFKKLILPFAKRKTAVMQHSSTSLLLIGHHQNIKATYTLASIVDAVIFIKGKNIDEIIFAEGDISFKQIIACMQQLGNSYTFHFCAAGSNAIISSNDKNNNGEVILL